MNVDATTLFQIIGEKDVELALFRGQLNATLKVLAETKQKLKELEEAAKATPVETKKKPKVVPLGS